jgi:hypothetical protein
VARSWLAFVVASVAVIAARPGVVRACIDSQMPAKIDPSLKTVDRTPPVLPPIPPPLITRGHGPQGCAGSTVTSCDDLGEILFSVAGADDMTPAARLGYSFSLESGTLPDGFTLPPTPLEPQTATSIGLAWVDGAVDGQDPLDFTLRIVAVDGAGNESVPQHVQIRQGGSGGCRVGPSARADGTGGFLVVAAAALAARRRRSGA